MSSVYGPWVGDELEKGNLSPREKSQEQKELEAHEDYNPLLKMKIDKTFDPKEVNMVSKIVKQE